MAGWGTTPLSWEQVRLCQGAVATSQEEPHRLLSRENRARRGIPSSCTQPAWPSHPDGPWLPQACLAFPAACLRNRAPETSQTPIAQALGTEPGASVPGWACGYPGCRQYGGSPAAALALVAPHTLPCQQKAPEAPFLPGIHWSAYVCKCTPVPVLSAGVYVPVCGLLVCTSLHVPACVVCMRGHPCVCTQAHICTGNLCVCACVHMCGCRGSSGPGIPQPAVAPALDLTPTDGTSQPPAGG